MTNSKESQIETQDRPRRLWRFRRVSQEKPDQSAVEPFRSFSHLLGSARIQTEDVAPRARLLRWPRRRRPQAKPNDLKATPFRFRSPSDPRGAPRLETEDLMARSLYGKLLVRCYILFVGAVLIGPFVAWALISQTRSAAQFMGGLRNVQDFALAMLGGLSVLGGFVGLIIGRYFSTHEV